MSWVTPRSGNISGSNYAACQTVSANITIWGERRGERMGRGGEGPRAAEELSAPHLHPPPWDSLPAVPWGRGGKVWPWHAAEERRGSTSEMRRMTCQIGESAPAGGPKTSARRSYWASDGSAALSDIISKQEKKKNIQAMQMLPDLLDQQLEPLSWGPATALWQAVREKGWPPRGQRGMQTEGDGGPMHNQKSSAGSEQRVNSTRPRRAPGERW